jgi:hypothetical protein
LHHDALAACIRHFGRLTETLAPRRCGRPPSRVALQSKLFLKPPLGAVIVN